MKKLFPLRSITRSDFTVFQENTCFMAFVRPLEEELHVTQAAGDGYKHMSMGINGGRSSIARSGWRFPAQKLTETRPLQQKPAQNFNCQNNVIWFYYHVNQD